MEIITINSIIEDVVLRTHYMRKRNYFSIKRLNFLYECTSCHRYHREYQRELKEDACPHCLSQEISSVKEEYKWMDYHPDCLALNYNIYKNYIVNKIRQEQRGYDDRSINKFLESFISKTQ